MDMAEAVARKSADSQGAGAAIHPAPVHQESHPADVPETLASLTAVERELGWEPTVFFPDAPSVAGTGSLERSPVTFSR